MTVEGANGAIPTIGLVGFSGCSTGEKYSEETSTLRYVSAANLKLPEKPKEEPAPAQNGGEKKDDKKPEEKKNEPPKEEKKVSEERPVLYSTYPRGKKHWQATPY